MVSHKVVLSRKVVLSWQALFRVALVVSPGTCGGCGRTPQPWHDYDTGTGTLLSRLLSNKHSHIWVQGTIETRIRVPAIFAY